MCRGHRPDSPQSVPLPIPLPASLVSRPPRRDRPSDLQWLPSRRLVAWCGGTPCAVRMLSEMEGAPIAPSHPDSDRRCHRAVGARGLRPEWPDQKRWSGTRWRRLCGAPSEARSDAWRPPSVRVFDARCLAGAVRSRWDRIACVGERLVLIGRRPGRRSGRSRKVLEEPIDANRRWRLNGQSSSVSDTKTPGIRHEIVCRFFCAWFARCGGCAILTVFAHNSTWSWNRVRARGTRVDKRANPRTGGASVVPGCALRWARFPHALHTTGVGARVRFADGWA